MARSVEATLRREGAVVLRGGCFDRWDLMYRGGLLGSSRLVLAVEEHGGGRQLARFKWWPRCSGWAFAVPTLLATLATLAFDESRAVAVVLGLGALAYGVRLVAECAAATAAFHAATLQLGTRDLRTDSIVADFPRLNVATEAAD